MAIAYVTKGSAYRSGYPQDRVVTVSSVACGTDANTAIIGFVMGSSSIGNAWGAMKVAGSATGVTAQTEVVWGVDDNARFYHWLGTGPGTVDITFEWTGDISEMAAGVLVYSGVDAVENYSSSGSTTSANYSITVNSATGDLALGIVLSDTPTVTFTAGTGGTERMDDRPGGNALIVATEEPGAASVTVDGTFSGTTAQNARFGVSLSSASVAAFKPAFAAHLLNTIIG